MSSNVSPTAVMEQLGIDRASFRSLGLLLLVDVAWADGKIQMGERLVINGFARDKGWLSGRVAALVDGWLRNRPSEDEIIAGATAFATLAGERRGLGTSIPEDTLSALMLACRDVAEASGGLFGLKSPICKEENEALQRAAESLGLARGRSWREVIAELEVLPAESNVPRSSGRFLLGDAVEMLSDPLQHLLDSWRRFGDVVRVDVGPTFFYLVVHPDDVKHVLVDNARNYVRDEIVDELKRVFGEGLLTGEGEFWRGRRRLLQPGFHVQKINGMAATMVEISADFCAELPAKVDSGQPVDMAEELSKLTLRIAGRALFSAETSTESADFRASLEIVLDEIADRHRSVVKLPGFLPTRGNLRFRDALEAMDEIVYRIIESRRRTGDSPDDLLALMMGMRDADSGAEMSNDELRNELLLILSAGHETSANALVWTLYYLSKNPATTRALKGEIDRELAGRLPTAADIPRLALTRAVLQESIRLRPPGWIITRKAASEDNLSGHRIPAGSNLIISPYLTHRHPRFWANPEGFDPERFMAEADKDYHPMAYMPFGGGPRKCIGMGFAMMEMQIVLAMLLSSYDFHLPPGFEPELSASVTLRPRDGCWMTVHRA